MIRPFKGIIPKIDPSTFIAETAVIIGDVEIGPLSSIWYNSVLRGDVNLSGSEKAPTSRTSPCCMSLTGKTPRIPVLPLIIGDFVTIAHGVTLHGCTIENGAFIGMQAVVMDKAVVGRRISRGSPRPGYRGHNNRAWHLVARITGPLQTGSDRRGIETNPDLGRKLHPLCRGFQKRLITAQHISTSMVIS